MAIKLKKILQLLDKYDSNPLAIKSIGDGFLCSKNELYRKIRIDTLKYGYKFSSKEQSPHYTSPLLGLNDMLKKKIVHVWQNLYWLKRLEKERPEFYTLKDLYLLELNFNYLLHESAHIIAYKETFKTWKSFNTERRDHAFTMKIMLGEAFANTCEVLAQVQNLSPIEEYIYRNNFYFLLSKEQHLLIQKCHALFGKIKTTKILYIIFLYANFLYKDLDDNDLKRILKLVSDQISQINDEQKEIVHMLAKSIPLQLNISFRLQTTRIYLTTVGYSGNIFKNLNLDPGKFLEKNPEFMDIISNLAEKYS